MFTKAQLSVLLVAIMCVIALVSARRAPPLYTSNGYTSAANADEITNLPDAAPWPSKQFSGYLEVANKTSDYFYWFVEAKNSPATAPVLIWSAGGPNCSGLLSKLTEMGPYQPTSDGKGGVKLVLRPVTWNEDFNIIYIEQPDVGFTNILRNKPQVWTDAETAKRNVDAIKSFFIKFPQYQKNPFGITSESYGGHYIPTLNRELISQINAGTIDINYKWSIVGNPLIYLPMRDFGQYKIQIQRQLIPSWQLGEEYMAKCQPDPQDFSNPPKSRPSKCDLMEAEMDQYTSRTDPYAMSFPICVDSNGDLKSSGHGYGEYIRETIGKVQRRYKNHTLLDTMAIHETIHKERKMKALQQTGDKLVDQLLGDITGKSEDTYFPENYQACEEDYTTMYLNRKDVQAALHANLKRSSWSMCQGTNYSDHDFIESMLPVYVENSKTGPQVKQLIFSGTDDTMCSTVESQLAIFNNWTVGKDAWKEVSLNGQLVGHKSTFVDASNLTFVTVHGAGHMCPSTRPAHTYEVIKRFTQGTL